VDAVVRALVEQHGVSVGVEVAAFITGFSEDKVRELCRAGRFPGHRAGTRVMVVFVPEFVEWMRNGGEAPYEPSPPPPGSHVGPGAIGPRRKADRPQWMDRVRSGSSGEALNGQS
jgi:hypothetical protein